MDSPLPAAVPQAAGNAHCPAGGRRSHGSVLGHPLRLLLFFLLCSGRGDHVRLAVVAATGCACLFFERPYPVQLATFCLVSLCTSGVILAALLLPSLRDPLTGGPSARRILARPAGTLHLRRSLEVCLSHQWILAADSRQHSRKQRAARALGGHSDRICVG